MTSYENSLLCSRSVVLPATDGTVTLPEVLDFHNQHQPQETMFTFKFDNDPEVTNISFLEFSRAADRVAHFIRPGRGGDEGEVVAVMALSDTLLYQAVVVGLVRAGMVPYVMSPRNTAAAIIKMLRETQCHKIITTQETLKSLISDITSMTAEDTTPYPLQLIEMPNLKRIFPCLGRENISDPFAQYPKPGCRPSLDKTVMILHSSGSTGIPKSIRQSFLMVANWAALPGIALWSNDVVGCMALPAFHLLGFASQIIRALYHASIVAIYPPVADTPSKLPILPTPNNIIDHARRTKSNVLVGIPAFYQAWAQEEETVRYLASLKHASFSGGPLPSETGKHLIEAGVKLVSIYGGTEFGAPAYVTRQPPPHPSAHPWEYLSFDENINVRFESQGDGTYELQFLRHDARHDLPVENMGPHVRGYATSDLWVPHPSEPGFWKLMGHKDDVIIHSSGEMTMPAPIENIISQSPFVTGVVMFGREHDQPGLLIELDNSIILNTQDEADVAKVRNVIWPVVDQANKSAPAYSRVYKEFILFSDPRRPLPRAGKGTVMRKAALTEYHDEIETLYVTVMSATAAQDIISPASWIESDISQWLLVQLSDSNPHLHFDSEKDLFDQGLDSLGATVLRRRICAALKSDNVVASSVAQIGQSTIYSYPTVRSLATRIAEQVRGAQNGIDKPTIRDPAGSIDAMIAKYSRGLDAKIDGTQAVPCHNHIVLLTGSTGNLGSEILETLLRRQDVSIIYAFNRPSSESTFAKHEGRFQEKGFDVGLLRHTKLKFLQGDASVTNLGLSQRLYDEIKNRVTVIIHTAWRLNFNLPLPSFEPNIRGTRNLVELGRASPYGDQVRFIFTSSVSQAFSWDTTNGPYPEEVVRDSRYAVGMGYGEGKYVCERLIASSGLRATSLRIGQITGATSGGVWATTDWVPMMVKSSITLGSLPSQSGTASWIRMNDVARIINDIAFSNSQDVHQALNIVHPCPVLFDTIMANINETLVASGTIRVPLGHLPQAQWTSLLEERSLSDKKDVTELMPALKLLDFFRAAGVSDAAVRSGTLNGVESGGIAQFSTSKSIDVSATMKGLSTIGKNDTRGWVSHWRTVGFLTDAR